MARFQLDEMECDEIYHALLERKQSLDKIAKKLEEDEGLPEAAQQVRKRISLYVSDDATKKVGLTQRFKPQSDLTTEAHDVDDRDPDRQQDAFGGGAETGGGHKAGETVKGAKKAKKKGDGKSAAATATVKAADAKANDDVTDADFEIIPEGRRLNGGPAESAPAQNDAPPIAPKVLDAVNRVDQIAEGLLAGPAAINDDEYTAELSRVLELVPAMNPNIDRGYLEAHLGQELRGSSEGNAHALAYFLQRQVSAIRGDVAPVQAAGGLSFAQPDNSTGAIVSDTAGG
jgi:hypothetical protein